MRATDPIPAFSSEQDYEPSRTSLPDEVIMYNDGKVANIYTTPGARIQFYDRGNGSLGEDPCLKDPMGYWVVVRTKSGNYYYVSDGLLVNARNNLVTDFVKRNLRLDDIVVGKPWCPLGSDMMTTDVEKVAVANTAATGHYPVDRPSPFTIMEDRIGLGADRDAFLRRIGQKACN